MFYIPIIFVKSSNFKIADVDEVRKKKLEKSKFAMTKNMQKSPPTLQKGLHVTASSGTIDFCLELV